MTIRKLIQEFEDAIQSGHATLEDKVSFRDKGTEYEVDYILYPKEPGKLYYTTTPQKRVQLCWDDGTY